MRSSPSVRYVHHGCSRPSHLINSLVQGTWHYMSVYLLDNPGRPTTIRDELESFFHVIVYGGMCRLRSTIKSIETFNHNYFAGFLRDASTGNIMCPHLKEVAVSKDGTMQDKATFFTPDGNMHQGHLINELLQKILTIIHSRYKVLQWEKQCAAVQAMHTPRTPSNSARLGPRRLLASIAEESEDEDVEDRSEEFRKRKQWKTPSDCEVKPVSVLKKPTKKTYNYCNSLDSHDTVLGILYTYLYENKKWPAADVIPDRMPTARPVLSQHSMDDDDSQAARPAKKARRERSAQPALPPPSPPPHPPTEDDDSARPVTRKRSRREPPAQPALRPPSPPPMDDEPARPAKRARREPRANPIPPSDRVTRSRSAANVAAAPQLQPPQPAPAPAPAPGPSNGRVTRSRSKFNAAANATAAVDPPAAATVAATTNRPTTVTRQSTRTSARNANARGRTAAGAGRGNGAGSRGEGSSRPRRGRK
ncbi:hypothetical protein C8Q80DRAFT_204868 [Daedaleopsis nitida]|nr:hypothetical protein C8Q80DRAFT_204868 [Daedaleopsis nitida]